MSDRHKCVLTAVGAAIVLVMLAGSPAQAAREFPLFAGPGDQHAGGFYRNIILLEGEPTGSVARELLYYDLYTSQVKPVPVFPGAQVTGAAVYEDIVAWTHGKDYSPRAYYADIDVYATRLSTGEVFPVCVNPAEQFNVSVGDRLIVWTDCRNQTDEWADTDVYFLDLSTGVEGAAATGSGTQGYMCVPRTSGNIVVWSDTSSSGGGVDLYGYNIDTQETFSVAVGLSDPDQPEVWGDSIAFPLVPLGEGRGLYLFDIPSRTLSPIAAEDSAALEVDMCGDMIVWTDFRNYDQTWTDVYAYDQGTDEEFAVCTAPRYQFTPLVYGDLVIWSDDRNYEDGVSGVDVYACDLERLPFWDLRVDEWSFSSISAVAAHDIALGYPDRSYRPKYAITRDQMAAYISRAMAGGDANVPSPAPGTQTFADVDAEHWAYSYVEYASAQGVVTGYDDQLYHSADPVDRGQMAVFVARSRGWVALDDDMTTAPELFPDVPAGYWAGTAIEACVDQGVVQGYDDGYYRPDTTVTRDQMAVYVGRAFELPM
jgi:hypothetical protein